tara:strand:- start:949 stop:1185 length:237 start_codon:yes stop_codon:yes gene_type:complete
MLKYVMVTPYTTDDLEWDSESDYQVAKDRYGKEPIYFVYERSWTKHKVYSNIPNLYSESGGYSVIKCEHGPNDAIYVR